jgi:predicted GNAT family acetyltransferase
MPDPKPTSASYHPTTTHAAWGAGHPRLLVTSEHDRYVHEIDCDLTLIGSADGSDLVLRAADPLHARIMHDTSDEYVLEMVGAGETSHGREAVLRTGAHFTAGPWRLVFARDEFADHGRPYGGRNGGEGAHQMRQQPRPDYAKDHPASSLTRCELKKPEQTSGAEQIKAIAQAVLTDATVDAPGDRTLEFEVVNDENAGIYEAVVGDQEVGGVTYNLVGDDRIVLLAVSVFPEFRGRGIATELIRRVLDDVRADGRTLTNYCPVVASFIEDNPDYGDLVDREHPGRVHGRRLQG